MERKALYWIANITGVVLVASALPTVCYRLVTIERPLAAALAYLGIAVWLAVGEAIRGRIARHIIEHECLEHSAYTYPGMALPIAALWPLVAILHVRCSKPEAMDEHA